MKNAKSVLRSFIVLGLVLGIGFFGLWFLGGTEIRIKNSNTDNSASNTNTSTGADNGNGDQFSGVGGKTPGETLTLLIKALENNNLTLAVEYFIPDSRETESEDLTKLYNANILGDLIKDLKNIKSGELLNDNQYKFTVYDETGQSTAEIELIKNSSGFWKINSL